MIYYTSAEANFWRVFTIWYGSVIPRCLPQAIFAALLAEVFEIWDLAGSHQSLIQHPYVVTMLGMVLGYVLVQRSNLAYQRWWEARTSLALLSTRWAESAMMVIEFERDSTLPDARHFRARMIHLFSLLHALCLADLRADWKYVDGLETISADDPYGIDLWAEPSADAPGRTPSMSASPAAVEVGRAGPSGTPGKNGKDAEMRPAHEHLRRRASTRTHRSNSIFKRHRGSGLSLLHFAATGLLYSYDPGAFKRLALAHTFPVIGGVSPAERRCLARSHSRDRAFLVRTWILRLALRRSAAGGLPQPPPVTTRIYQLIAEGAAGYQQARKVGDTPFPFPYVQLVTLLLHAFNFIAPLTVSALINTARDLSPEEAAEQPRGGINAPRDSGHALLWAMAFCVTLGYTALNQVARELEEPFGHGPNHLPLVQLAEEFNSSLVHLLIADAGAKIPDDPFIGADAELLSEEVKQARRVQYGNQKKRMGPGVMAALDRTKEDHGAHAVSDMVHTHERGVSADSIELGMRRSPPQAGMAPLSQVVEVVPQESDVVSDVSSVHGRRASAPPSRDDGEQHPRQKGLGWWRR